MLQSIIQCTDNPEQLSSIRPLCPTRWTCRTVSIKSVLDNYSSLMTLLDTISCSFNDEHSRKASGMLALMEKFDTYFGLCVAVKVFGAAEELSRGLQAKHITAQEAFLAAECTRQFYNGLRNESAFHTLFESAKVAAAADPEGRIGEPTTARRRKVPKKIDGDAEHFFESNPESSLRRQFFEILDILDTQLVERFHQPAFTTIQNVERLFEEAAKGNPTISLEFVKKLYGGDLDVQRLQIQLR